MDRGLLTRALVIGFLCFVLIAGGLYYLSLTSDQPGGRVDDVVGTVTDDGDGISAIGALIVVAIGFLLLMIAAGALTTLVSVRFWTRPGDIFQASALAGCTAVILSWLLFWCLSLTSIIGGIFNHESFGSGDLVFLGGALLVNVLMAGMGAAIAGASGHAARLLAMGIARLAG